MNVFWINTGIRQCLFCCKDQLFRAASVEARSGVGLIAIALGLMWSADLAVAVIDYAMGSVPTLLIGLRGLVDIGVGLLLATAAQRRGS